MKLLMGLALVAYVVCKWSGGRRALHSSGSFGQAGKLARFFWPREGRAGCFPCALFARLKAASKVLHAAQGKHNNNAGEAAGRRAVAIPGLP